MSSTLNRLDGLIAGMSLAERIKEAMGEKSPADIARATGKTPGAVSQWLDGQTRSLKAETAALLESATGYRAGWIATGKGEKRIHAASSIPPSGNFGHPTAVFSDAGQVSRMARVAVVGTARMGDNGYYEEISSMPGAGDGTVLAQSDDPNAYALRVRGDSMFPAIRDGWYVVIEPGATPTPGEYVLIKLRNGQKMVKELILHRSDSITVVSVNGEKRRTIMADEIDPHYGIQAVVSILAPSKWRP